MLITEVKTTLSSFEIFSLFKDKEHCFFLDSAMTSEHSGRYSFIGFEPSMTFQSKNGIVGINGMNRNSVIEANPFDQLKTLLSGYETDYTAELPFIGGAVGYFGYDMGRHIENLPKTAADDTGLPDCWFGIYDRIIAVDHVKAKVYAAAAEVLGDAKAWAEDTARAILSQKPDLTCLDLNAARQKSKLTPNLKKEKYLACVEKIKDYIEAGDVYQVNMTQRFECGCEFTPYELYYRLRSINPAPFACYMDFGSGVIISSSPERFMRISSGRVQTKPIKGTIPRGKTGQEDDENRETLLSSEKDKAELLMIVDLERNDIGKVCKTGSVQVPELFCLEAYPTVYHLVSTVEGELNEGVCAVDCVRALFPGGSITGAPKIRAMEIIDALEPTRRNIYTGSIGYIGFNGDADFNIAIRTLIQTADKAFFQVGGGIVWDSGAQAEYEECMAKAKALIATLNAEL